MRARGLGGALGEGGGERPIALKQAVKEGLHLAVALCARRRTWLLETPDRPIAVTRSSTARVEMP